MKLKEFKTTETFAYAKIVEYHDQDGKEIVTTTQVQWRRLQNKEVMNYTCKTDPETGLNYVSLILNI